MLESISSEYSLEVVKAWDEASWNFKSNCDSANEQLSIRNLYEKDWNVLVLKTWLNWIENVIESIDWVWTKVQIYTARFNFLVWEQEKGNISDKDLFISAENKTNENIKLLVDNDFCTESIALPNPKFTFSEDEKSIALKLITNTELRNYYSDTKTNISDSITNTNSISRFYGEPTASLKIDDYVKLPTLEDYFIELPFNVKVKKEKGKKYFRILGTHPELFIYDPLIMVDMIPIYNTENILKIDPNKVEKLDVITEPYALGDIIYGGILNVVTKKNDFAGIDLPKSGIFINYKFLTPNVKEKKISSHPNLPDSRTTLYWNNNLDSSFKNFEFKTSDTPGIFIILVKAITKNGKDFQSSVKIIVN